MRIHDQLYTQIKTSARKIYDEQRSRKLYNFAGNNIILNSKELLKMNQIFCLMINYMEN